MPFFQSGDEWLRESTLLVQARPTTTKISTRYNHARPLNRARRRSQARRKAEAESKAAQPGSTDADSDATAQQAAGLLVLKTYDPVSGACLQYKTDKGAEVGRLIAALGRLAHCMAGVPDAGKDVVMADAAGGAAAAAIPAPAVPRGNDEVVMDDAPADEAEVDTAKTHQRQKKSVSFAEGPPQVQKAPQQAQAQAPSGGSGGGGGGGGGKKKKKGKK